MRDIRYFDACCVLGHSLRVGPQFPCTPAQLVEEMDHFGIHEALVLDSMSVFTNPRKGNQRILEWTHDEPRLHPAWALLLPSSQELPPPEKLVRQMHDAGVGAVWLFYRHFLLPLEDWALDEMLAPLAEARVPVFFSPDSNLESYWCDATDWHSVVALCRRFPTLPVIISENRIYRSQRALFAALDACPNLHVDISALWLHRSIEFICRQWGAERLVWASHLPERTPGAVLMQLNYSDISEEELALIAGDNLRRLLSWNAHISFVKEAQFPAPVDTLHRKVRLRQSLADEKFYDCHGHIGWGDPYHVVHDSPAEIVAEMDKFGLQICCVFGMQIMGDNEEANKEVVQMLKAYPERFIGFTFVNPYYGEEAMEAQLQWGLQQGMQGIKLMLNSYNTYPAEGPLVEVPCRFANQHGLMILSHTWGSAERLRELCRRYPNACFIAGHATPAYVDVCAEMDNLYICTCPCLGWRQTEQYVAMYGAERLLFGSDLTDLPIAWGLGQILYARISEEDKRKILGDNLWQIFQKYGLGPWRKQ